MLDWITGTDGSLRAFAELRTCTSVGLDVCYGFTFDPHPSRGHLSKKGFAGIDFPIHGRLAVAKQRLAVSIPTT